ncbi:hypothetical protein [Methylobacterium sp. ap11]|nr:hypothetical protein [Methylobacterium sp. ap11]
MTQTVPFGGKDLRVLLKDSAADTPRLRGDDHHQGDRAGRRVR